PKFEVKADVAQGVAQYLQHLQRSVAPQQIEQLAAVVQRFVANKGEADIHKWANAVDMTATRMGFLICNDLEIATRIVQTEPVSRRVGCPLAVAAPDVAATRPPSLLVGLASSPFSAAV